MRLLFSIACSVLVCTGTLYARNTPTLDNTIICGYQGWFTCYNDGSPVERWSHWSGGSYRSDTPKPSPGHQSFELYPDMTEYPEQAQFQTGYAALGDGRPATLFSSYREETIDLHCRWMQEAGIDGVALQRFLGETRDAVFKAHRDSVAVRLMRACEKYDRMFYLMYDGVGNSMGFLQQDWRTTIVETLRLTSSPRYAHMDGKPVVCLWGLGFSHYSDTRDSALFIINWFRSNGYYVIGGVPTNWRTGTSDSKPDYADVYAAYDMVSPWTPGRFKWDVEIDNYRADFLEKDKARLDSLGIRYQPVMFPGFAWSNWKESPPNDFPRRHGQFMWRQYRNIRSLGINHIYIAMFDEYDEGTAIAKAAADFFDVPTNQYFQTLSIDGEYVSPDFYLRLAGEATRLLKTNGSVPELVPVARSSGPVFWRSSFEPVDAALSWKSTPEPDETAFVNVRGENGTGAPVCSIAAGVALSGARSLRYCGSTTGTGLSAARFRIVDVDIPVYANTRISYCIRPDNEPGRHVAIDFITVDGHSLAASGAMDTAGVPLAADAPRGSIGSWTRITCNPAAWFAGKTIDRMVVGFAWQGEQAIFSGFIDDLVIETQGAPVALRDGYRNGTIAHPASAPVVTWVNGIIAVRCLTGHEPVHIAIFDLSGRCLRRLNTVSAPVPVRLGSGIYLVRVASAGEAGIWQKMVVGRGR